MEMERKEKKKKDLKKKKDREVVMMKKKGVHEVSAKRISDYGKKKK